MLWLFATLEDVPAIFAASEAAGEVRNPVNTAYHLAYCVPVGEGQGLGFLLSQAVRQVLATNEQSDRWSNRTRLKLAELRGEFPWLDAESTVVVPNTSGELQWWTFAGSRANGMLARELSRRLSSQVDHDSFLLNFESRIGLQELRQVLEELRTADVVSIQPEVDESALEGLKFSERLPPGVGVAMLERRLANPESAQITVNQPVRFISYPGTE